MIEIVANNYDFIEIFDNINDLQELTEKIFQSGNEYSEKSIHD
jgi:hypothetical protein